MRPINSADKTLTEIDAPVRRAAFSAAIESFAVEEVLESETITFNWATSPEVHLSRSASLAAAVSIML